MAGNENSGRHAWKFTHERRQAILQSISDRIPYELSAEANGICEDTLYNWINLGKEHLAAGIDSDYSIFVESIKKTEQIRIKNHLEIIADKPERWQADAWILERRWWKYYSSSAAIIEFNKKLDRLDNNSHSEIKEKLNAELKEMDTGRNKT